MSYARKPYYIYEENNKLHIHTTTGKSIIHGEIPLSVLDKIIIPQRLKRKGKCNL